MGAGACSMQDSSQQCPRQEDYRAARSLCLRRCLHELVGDMLVGRKPEELEMDVSLTPNVILNNKDRAHASRRLSMCGWMADPYLKKIHLSMTGKGTEQCICSRFGSKWMKGRIRMNRLD